jgi:hypothetical protein
MIMLTSCLPMVGGSLRLLPPIKTDCHDIAEILLKVALSTIKQTSKQYSVLTISWYCACYLNYFLCYFENKSSRDIIDNHYRYTVKEQSTINRFFVFFFVFNVTFSNISAISWRPVLEVVEARVPGDNHRPWASNW